MRYYKKIYPKVKLYAKNGQSVPFELLNTNIGVIKLDEEKDKEFVDFLDGLIKANIGGIFKITEQDYENLKKNPPSNRRQSVDPLKTLRLFNPNNPVEMEKTYAPNVKAQVTVTSAATDVKPAQIVAEQDTVDPVRVTGRGIKVKVGKAKPKPVLEENKYAG